MSPNIRVKVLMLSKPGSIRPPMEKNLAEKQTHNCSLLLFGTQEKFKHFSKGGQNFYKCCNDGNKLAILDTIIRISKNMFKK
jgi:hypothetical protein